MCGLPREALNVNEERSVEMSESDSESEKNI